jgi:hypothetical protein
MPPNSIYGFFIDNFTTEGGITYRAKAPGGNTTPTYTDGFVTIATGLKITFKGRDTAPNLNPPYFFNGIRYHIADRAPNDAGINAINTPVNFSSNPLHYIRLLSQDLGLKRPIRLHKSLTVGSNSANFWIT